MRKFREQITAFALALFLIAPLLAEEVWVRNRPFEGQVQGDGASMKVELEPLLEALELEVERQGEQLVFGDFLVPVEVSPDGTQMVLLREIATGAGLKVKRNPDLGTVDVYSDKAGDGSGGDWAALESSTPGGGSVKETAAYKITVPSELEFTDDPQAMAALKNYGASQSSASSPAVDNLQIKFVLSSRRGSEDAVMFLMHSRGLPPMPNMSEEMKLALVSGFGQGIEQRGGQLKSGPTPTQLGGRNAHKFEHLQGESGTSKIVESYLYVDGSAGEFWVMMFGDKTSTFNQSAASFHKALQSFRFK